MRSFFFGRWGPYVAGKARMGGSELAVVEPRLVQAELPVYGGVHVEDVVRVLAVVFPPADRA